jgi:hypothetical protein
MALHHVEPSTQYAFGIFGTSLHRQTGSLVASTSDQRPSQGVVAVAGPEPVLLGSGGTSGQMQLLFVDAVYGIQYTNYGLTLPTIEQRSLNNNSIAAAGYCFSRSLSIQADRWTVTNNTAISSNIVTSSFDQLRVIDVAATSAEETDCANAAAIDASMERLRNAVSVITEGGLLATTPEFEKLLARASASREGAEDIDQWAATLAADVGDLND